MDSEVKLIMKHAPEWVQTSDLVIRSPEHYLWTATVPTCEHYVMLITMHYILNSYKLCMRNKFMMIMNTI